MSTFRDAIMRALHQATHDLSEDPALRNQSIDECDEMAPEGWIGEAFVAYDLAADAVLTSPEMQTIRATLRKYVLPHDDFCLKHGLPTDLPESVIEWVLG